MYIIDGMIIDEKLWNELKTIFKECSGCENVCTVKCGDYPLGRRVGKLQETYCGSCVDDEDCTNPFDCEDFKKNVKVIPGNVDTFIHGKVSSKEYTKIIEDKLKTFEIRNNGAGKLRNKDWNKIFIEQLKS